MTIEFGSTTFAGVHGRVFELPPENHHRETHFYGLRGSSIINSGQGSRDLNIDYWLFDEFQTFAEINFRLYEIDRLVGAANDLQVIEPPDGANPRPVYLYKDCLFLGFFRTPFVGQDVAVPLLDYANTVDGGYHIRGFLRFRQLVVKV